MEFNNFLRYITRYSYTTLMFQSCDQEVKTMIINPMLENMTVNDLPWTKLMMIEANTKYLSFLSNTVYLLVRIVSGKLSGEENLHPLK